jgi:methionyl-tRNA synthetase
MLMPGITKHIRYLKSRQQGVSKLIQEATSNMPDDISDAMERIQRRIENKYKTESTTPKAQKCESCGAPLHPLKDKCEYCGTIYTSPSKNWGGNFLATSSGVSDELFFKMRTVEK